MARNFSNISVATTLSAGIAAGDLGMVVASATGYPTVPFAVVIDPGNALLEEVVLVTAVAGTTWTITRAYDGTTAVAHSAAADVRHSAIADDFRGKVIGQRDMATTAPSDGQAVVWSAAGSTWQPGAPALGGAAGGVLSGTYPNPGFAVDMATQAELDAEASTRAAADAAEASARATADSTHAALTTSAHGGIVASTDPRLTDARTPTAHQSTHLAGNSDALSGNLDAIARVGVRKNSTGSVFQRRRINLIEGSNITLTVADDSGNEEIDVTIAASGGGSIDGSGTATRMAEWLDSDTLQASTLIKSGAGVLTVNVGTTQTWRAVGNTFALGAGAANSVTSADYYTAIGANAANASTTGSEWLAIGAFAGDVNVGGIKWTAIGVDAGGSNTSGGYWTAIGSDAGTSNQSGEYWTAIGVNAGSASLTGGEWMAIGPYSGGSNTSGNRWVAIGVDCAASNQSGGDWIAIGNRAGYNNVSGSRNVFIGYRAGYSELGSDKLYIEPSDSTRPLIYGDFSADALTLFATDAATSAVRVQCTLDYSSSGTPAAGFGSRLLFALKSSTTVSQSAASIDAAWATATHAARSAFVSIKTVENAAALAEVARFDKSATAGNTGLLLWDSDNGAVERVTVGAADSGGAGFKVLRIPN